MTDETSQSEENQEPAGGRSDPSPAGSLVVGTAVTLRKPHGCGGRTWRIVYVGADVGLVCDTCGRRINLPRAELTRRRVGGSV